MSFNKTGKSLEEQKRLKRAEKVDLITFPPGIPATNCANCQFVDLAKSYCKHPEVNMVLKDTPQRMCCNLWASPGTLREWEKP